MVVLCYVCVGSCSWECGAAGWDGSRLRQQQRGKTMTFNLWSNESYGHTHSLVLHHLTPTARPRHVRYCLYVACVIVGPQKLSLLWYYGTSDTEHNGTGTASANSENVSGLLSCPRLGNPRRGHDE